MAGPTNAVLVIPAWNEAQAIGAVLDEVPPGLVEQVLVIVSGPGDSTVAAVRGRGARVLVQRQPGYGAACLTGAEVALASGADIVVFLDGDYADPPAELGRVLAPILAGRADLVLGQRLLSGSPGALPVHARAGNWLVLRLIRALVGARFDDLPSFKAVRSDALRQLKMRELTYGWTVEMVIKAARAGLRIEQVPIAYRPRLGGRSKVAGTWRGSIRAATGLVRCAVAYGTVRTREPG